MAILACSSLFPFNSIKITFQYNFTFQSEWSLTWRWQGSFNIECKRKKEKSNSIRSKCALSSVLWCCSFKGKKNLFSSSSTLPLLSVIIFSPCLSFCALWLQWEIQILPLILKIGIKIREFNMARIADRVDVALDNFIAHQLNTLTTRISHCTAKWSCEQLTQKIEVIKIEKSFLQKLKISSHLVSSAF